MDTSDALWISALAFAHVYVVFFALRAASSLYPAAVHRVKGWLCIGRGKSCCAAQPALPRPRSGDIWMAATKLLPRGAPLELSWEGLGCSYETQDGVKTVLQDVSGVARPYELQALMGPSGAGKSTLLDILAARKTVGRLTGTVKVNGAPRGSSFVRLTAYVPQEDAFLPTMTVQETCELHAALRLGRGATRARREERIEEVLASMNMLHARHTLVGGVLPGGLALRGLSGGERRRVSVAIGCLAHPKVLFLDEPTSGLDACSALAVVEHLRDRAADSGLTIVASIHQPRASVWAAFNSVSILSGGLLMYSGPTSGLLPWFEGGLGYGPWDADAHGSVADWAIDLVNAGFTKPTSYGRTIETDEDLASAAAAFSAHYSASSQRGSKPQQPGAAPGSSHGDNGRGGARDDAQSDDQDAASAAEAGAAGARAAKGSRGGAAADASAAAEAAAAAAGGVVMVVDAAPAGTDSPGAPPAAAPPRGPLGWLRRGAGRRDNAAATGGAAAVGRVEGPSWWRQFQVLLWRELLSTMRNPMDVAGRMIIFAYVAVFIGLIFWRLGDDVDGLRNRLTLLYSQAQVYLLMPYVYMSLYSSDKAYFIADSSAKLFRVSAYYAAKTIAVIPFVLANVLAGTLIVYGMAGLRLDAGSIVAHCVACGLCYMTAQQVQALATILTPNQDSAFIISIAWTCINLYESNFLVRFSDMTHSWIGGLRYVSAVYYAFSGMLRAEFEGASASCAGGVAPDLIASLKALVPAAPASRVQMAARTLEQPGADCRMDFNAVLGYFNLDWPMWGYITALLIYLGAVHVASYLALLLLARKERR